MSGRFHVLLVFIDPCVVKETLGTLSTLNHGRTNPIRPKGSAEALEMRRRIAANLLKQGKGIREGARLVQASPSAVSRWKQALERDDEDALKAKPHPGKRPRLDAAQREQ